MKRIRVGKSWLFIALLSLASLWAADGVTAGEQAPTLEELVKQSLSAELRTTDQEERLHIRVVLLEDILSLALKNENAQAMQACEEAAVGLIKQARANNDLYSHSDLLTLRCEIYAAKGEWDKALQLSKAVPEIDRVALAQFTIATYRAKSGDMQRYRAEFTSSLAMLSKAVEADLRKPVIEQAFYESAVPKTVEIWINDLMRSGIWTQQEALAELDLVADAFGQLPGSPGCKAETAMVVADGYALVGDEEAAREWMARAAPWIEKEKERLAALKNPDDWWRVYGLDFAYASQVSTLVRLGEMDKARQVMQLIKSADVRALARADLAAAGKNDLQAGEARAAARNKVDRAIALQARFMKQPQDAFGKKGSIYELDVYFDFMYAAETAADLKAKDQIDRLLEGAKLDLMKVGARIGVAMVESRVEVKPEFD